MQHIIQEIVDNLQNFIADEEQSVMLIEAQAEEAPLILKTFGTVEEDEFSPDIFLSFPDDFEDTRRYVELIIERLREQTDAINEELEKIGKPPLAPIPSELLERDKPSQTRLVELFRHIRQTVEAERQLIWIFYPLTDVEKEKFFVNLFEDVARKTMAGDFGNTKLIVRDTPLLALKENLGCAPENPKVFCYRPQVDFQSVMKKIEAQAKNKEIPAEERVQSVMLMAGMDVAEKRYDKALSKNEQVLRHYQKTKQKQNESVVQNNIGDVYYLQGDFPKAQENYEKAITIAVAEEWQPLVLYQSMNLGNSLFMQQKYDEALIYYDSAEKLAEVNKILIQQIQALERMGDTKRAQGELKEAIKIYNEAADLCRENKYAFGLKSVLERLCEVHNERGDQKKHDECRDELKETKKTLDKIDPNLTKD